jgi:hypothetical protein
MKKSEKSTAADKVYRLRKKAAIQQANGTVWPDVRQKKSPNFVKKSPKMEPHWIWIFTLRN